MTTNEKTTSFFAQNNGTLKMVEAMESSVPKSAFYMYAKKHGAERVAQRVYLSLDAWTDAMYLLRLHCNQAVFSRKSVLFSHNLTDREPKSYSVTVKTGYNLTGLRKDGIKVYTVERELHGARVISMNTPLGNSVPVYNVECIICDIVHSRSRIEMQT